LTQSLPLEAACVIALASIILYPPYTRWMRAPGTARVQLVLFTTALVQTVLVPALMHMRGNAIFLRTVGGYPQHPKRSALAMAAYTPFLFFCLPITPSAAAPLLLLRTVLPIGALYAASLATSNLGAALLSVSFVQMIKALTPLVTLGAGIALRVEAFDRRQVLIVAVMCAGVIVASAGELLWNGVGVAFQVAAVCFEDTRVKSASVRVEKLHALPGAGSAGVEIERNRP
jgi:hypothetical protein